MSLDRMWSGLRSLANVVVTDRPKRGRTLARVNVEVLESRQLLTLTPVSTTAAFPYTSIVKLFITYPDNRNFVGSGSVLDSFHVLTAGHTLYSAADGGFARSIRVVPEMNGSYQPFGSAYMVYERTYTSFMNYNKAHPGRTSTGISDIGLLTLDRNIGRYTGSMGYSYDNNDGRFAAGRVMNTAGYPASGGYDGSRMYASSGAIAGLSGDRLGIQFYQSQITAFAGQSGSPVWEYNPTTRTRSVFGVLVGANGTASSLNFATRITQAIFNDLGRWRAADAAPRALAALGSSSSSGGGDYAGAFAAVTNVGPTPTYDAPARPVPATTIIVAPPASNLAVRESTSSPFTGASTQPVGQVTVKKQLAPDPGALARPLPIAVRGSVGTRRGSTTGDLESVLTV